jgi:hypothetical protein
MCSAGLRIVGGVSDPETGAYASSTEVAHRPLSRARLATVEQGPGRLDDHFSMDSLLVMS